MDRRFKAAMVLRFVAMFTAFAFLIGFVVMGLWNWLVPGLFHGPVVTYWQALGLLILSKILFGGFKGRGGHPGWRRGHQERMRRKLEAKMSTMSEEQREKLRKKLNLWQDEHGKMHFDGHKRTAPGQPEQPGTEL